MGNKRGQLESLILYEQDIMLIFNYNIYDMYYINTKFMLYTGKYATYVKYAFFKTNVKRTFNVW